MPRSRLKRLGFDLDGLTEIAIRDLENFVRGNASHADAEVSKLYRARSDAAKVGLSFVDALTRFADRLPGDDADSGQDIVARARAALARDKAETPERDRDNDE